MLYNYEARRTDDVTLDSSQPLQQCILSSFPRLLIFQTGDRLEWRSSASDEVGPRYDSEADSTGFSVEVCND